MNIRALNKLERIYVKRDWKQCLGETVLSKKQLLNMLDIIDSFKDKKSVKELVLLKYSKLPLYVTITWRDIPKFLDVLIMHFVSSEDYESCHRASEIKNVINKSLTNKQTVYDYSA